MIVMMKDDVQEGKKTEENDIHRRSGGVWMGCEDIQISVSGTGQVDMLWLEVAPQATYIHGDFATFYQMDQYILFLKTVEGPAISFPHRGATSFSGLVLSYSSKRRHVGWFERSGPITDKYLMIIIC